MVVILLFPLALAVFGLPISLLIFWVGRLLGMFMPLAGALYSMCGALVMCLGDPLVYLVNKMYPALLNVSDFGFFNLSPLIVISYPE